MRTDASRNRQRLIDVTIAMILEVGGQPAREAIAGRAGVGIGTLYRHFPDQQSLLHAAARHVLEQCIEAGEALVTSSPDGLDALRRYMHLALDNGIGVVNIVHPLLERHDWDDLRGRAAALMGKLVQGARAGRQVRSDFAERDLVFALIRFARPLAIGLPADQERAIAHRHLDIYLDGLCKPPARAAGGRTTNRADSIKET